MRIAAILLIAFAGVMEAQITMCSAEPETVGPYTLVQRCDYNSQINLPKAAVTFKTANKAGNWINVSIYAGQSYLHTFQITDTVGNTYIKAASIGNSTSDSTVAMFFADYIHEGTNTITVVPDHPGYMRIVIREYAGVSERESLDTATGKFGMSDQPESGTMRTNSHGDLIVSAAIMSDASSVSAGAGAVNVDFIPEPPGTKLVVEDEYQAHSGLSSACVTLGSPRNWAMISVAFKSGK
jgi:hypothetical protein